MNVNRKSKTIIILSITVLLLVSAMSILAINRFNMVNLTKTDISVYVNELSVSDVYKVSDTDLYFFIVWAGKRQEGYYVNFDKEVVSASPQPFSRDINSDKIKVSGIIKNDYYFIYNLDVSCEKTDNVTTFDVKGVASPENFKTRPLILDRKLIFIFNQKLQTPDPEKML